MKGQILLDRKIYLEIQQSKYPEFKGKTLLRIIMDAESHVIRIENGKTLDQMLQILSKKRNKGEMLSSEWEFFHDAALEGPIHKEMNVEDLGSDSVHLKCMKGVIRIREGVTAATVQITDILLTDTNAGSYREYAVKKTNRYGKNFQLHKNL